MAHENWKGSDRLPTAEESKFEWVWDEWVGDYLLMLKEKCKTEQDRLEEWF